MGSIHTTKIFRLPQFSKFYCFLVVFITIIVPLQLLPTSKCIDETTGRELIEVVCLKKYDQPGMHLVSALVDAASGTKNTDHVFMASVTKALGVGTACDWGVSLGNYFNQWFRPHIRFVLFCTQHISQMFFYFLFFFAHKTQYHHTTTLHSPTYIKITNKNKMAIHFIFF